MVQAYIVHIERTQLIISEKSDQRAPRRATRGSKKARAAGCGSETRSAFQTSCTAETGKSAASIAQEASDSWNDCDSKDESESEPRAVQGFCCAAPVRAGRPTLN